MNNITRAKENHKLQQQREIQIAAAQQQGLLQLQSIPDQKQQLLEQLKIENRLLRLSEVYQYPSFPLSTAAAAAAELTRQDNISMGNNTMPHSSKQQEQQRKQSEQIEHLRKQNRITLERQLRQSRERNSLELLCLQQQHQLNAALSQSLMPTAAAVAAASMPFVPSYSPHHHHALGSTSNVHAASMPSNFMPNNNFPITAGLSVNHVFLPTTNTTPPTKQQHGRQAARRGNSHTCSETWINKGCGEKLHHKLKKGTSSTMVSTTAATMTKTEKASDHRDRAIKASATAEIDGTRASTTGTFTPQKRKRTEQDSTKSMFTNNNYDTKHHRKEGEELPSSLMRPKDQVQVQRQIATRASTTSAVAVASLVNSDVNSNFKNKKERHQESKQQGTDNTSDGDLTLKSNLDQRWASAPMVATQEQFAKELLLLRRSSSKPKQNLENKKEQHQKPEKQGTDNTSDGDLKPKSNLDQRWASAPMLATQEQFAQELLLLRRSSSKPKPNLENKKEQHQKPEKQGTDNTSDGDLKPKSNLDQRWASAPMVATQEQFAQELLLLRRSSSKPKQNLENKKDQYQEPEQQGKGNTFDGDLKPKSNLDQTWASAPMVATQEQFAQELLLLRRSSSKPRSQQNKENLSKTKGMSATIPSKDRNTAPTSNNGSAPTSGATKPSASSATLATLIDEKIKLVKQYAANARSSITDQQQPEKQNSSLARDDRKEPQSTTKSLSASLPPSSDTKLPSNQGVHQMTGNYTDPLLISQLKEETQLKNQSLPCRLAGRNDNNNDTTVEECHHKLSSLKEDRIEVKKSAVASFSTKQQHEKHGDGKDEDIVDRSSATQKEDFESIHDFSPSRWNIMFDKLKQYKEEYGDCLVPVDTKAKVSQARKEEKNEAEVKEEMDLSRLGQWTVLQRQKKHLLCKDRLQRLRDIGFTWKNSKTLKPDEAWSAMFQRLLNYKQCHGDLLVPRTYKVDKQLAGWVVRQRERKQKLPQDRKKRLEDIGFPWNGSKEHRENWNVMFDRLVKYKEEYGHCNVPRFYEDDKLGRWVPRQRINKEAMSSVRRKRLEDIGFSWSIKKEQNIKVWNRMFNRLLKYKEDHGDLLVPEDYKDDSSLGRWVYLQRAKKNSLPPDRKQRLDDIQFVWEDYGPRRNEKSKQADDSWNEMFERLCDYKRANGHTRALRREGADPKLGYWAACQRARRHNLSDSRIQKLDSIGFVWSVNATDAAAAVSAPTDT